MREYFVLSSNLEELIFGAFTYKEMLSYLASFFRSDPDSVSSVGVEFQGD